MPSAGALRKFYADYPDFRTGRAILRLNAEKNIQFLVSQGLTRESRLLDFGCGRNVFVKQAGSKLWVGYDRFTRNSDSSLMRQKFNFIALWGVLEHLTDLVGEMVKLAGRLVSGGKLNFMYQNPDVYLKCVLNAGRVPVAIQKKIAWKRKEILPVPTNEVIVVGERK